MMVRAMLVVRRQLLPPRLRHESVRKLSVQRHAHDCCFESKQYEAMNAYFDRATHVSRGSMAEILHQLTTPVSEPLHPFFNIAVLCGTNLMGGQTEVVQDFGN